MKDNISAAKQYLEARKDDVTISKMWLEELEGHKEALDYLVRNFYSLNEYLDEDKKPVWFVRCNQTGSRKSYSYRDWQDAIECVMANKGKDMPESFDFDHYPF